ncbi:response regulator [Desulfacinum hydrothermale]|nr:response regulator [Desulfacinum hydrothermale]
MSDRVLQQMFTPYFTMKSNGTGLGMVSVHDVVKQACGCLVVRTVPEAGTHIVVMIPYVVSSLQLLCGNPNRNECLQLRHSAGEKRLLIVDDDTELAGMLAEGFSLSGFITDVACSKKEALFRLHACGPYDVIICDYNLVDGNGLEVCRKAAQVYSVPKTVLLTGDALLDPAEVEVAGSVVVLFKPVMLADLLRVVVE